MRRFHLVLLIALCATLGFTQQAAAPSPDAQPQRMKSFDLDALDRSVEPCQDFYRFACGGWNKANPIPPDQSRWGRFELLHEYNRALTTQILEKAAANKKSSDPNQRKIGDYYATCMDEAGNNARGMAPAERWLRKIDGIKNTKDLAKVVAALHDQSIGGMFAFRASAQLHNAAQTGAWADQGGLGLPNKDFYTKTDEKSVKIRQQYVEHIGNMLKLVGVPVDQAGAQAQQIMDIEMKLANASMTPTDRRNTTKLDHWMKLAEFEALAPSFAWDKYFVGVGSPAFTELNVAVPEFYTNLEGMLKSVPIAQWKTYLKWHLVHGHADSLPTQFGDENFNFYGKVLDGAQQQLPRWNRCARAVDGDLGEALGQYYVKEAFGGNAKERTLKMVSDIENAMEADIKSLDWMTDETKQKALEKLHAIANKIGYPDQWRDYSTLRIKRGDLLGNSLRSNRFERRRRLAKIGGPVDKTEWGMTPPTVNAYYSALQNNINFPAGILQPPFFDNDIDDAVNYGGIGVVIGHELTHGFDDSGSRYAANGNLQNWWTDQDKAEFEKRTACVADQYSGFSPIEGVNLNGKLTLGENTADNGGSRIAMMALRSSYQGHEPAEKDGFTPEQRFWIGFAQIWCESVRPERSRTMALSDPHSPGQFRTNGVASNSPDFQQAFHCKVGDPMVRKDACRVW
jgi:endothelin-converting enzyme/putative endopeptidase